MIRSLYASVSSMITLENQQNTVVNNMTNANTTGFKSDSLITKSFDEVYIANKESGVIGSLSLGAEIDTVNTSFTQGDFKKTDDNSDFAINGRGFFVIKQGNEYLYTRDGDFSVGTDGTLITSNGDQVMGINQNTGSIEAIFVGNNEYKLNGNNLLNIDGLTNYEILTADFEDYSNLEKAGANYYRGADAIMNSVVNVEQGYLEQSNVNITDEMVNLMTTLRNFESSQSIFKMIDSTLDIAANNLGKANQKKMDVISNNIVNVNTTGYKKLEVGFQDLLTSSLNEWGNPLNDKSALVGTGVKTTNVTRDFSQGTLLTTEKNTDIAIDGEGYFRVIASDGTSYYTRDGEFKLDSSGRLVDKQGNILDIQYENGYSANNAGLVIILK